jgi:hypothetical protein
MIDAARIADRYIAVWNETDTLAAERCSLKAGSKTPLMLTR